MRIGSLCTGIAGLELGLQYAGIETKPVFVSDIDPGACEWLDQAMPHTPNLGDFTELDELPEVDIITAGFPCQPVSTAGLRKGINDERWLFDDITRLVSRMDSRPVLFLENVPGILTADGGEAMGRVVYGLADIGYYITWGTLPAAAIGAPHRRNRWWGLAQHPDSMVRPTPRQLGPNTNRLVQPWDWSRTVARHSAASAHSDVAKIREEQIADTRSSGAAVARHDPQTAAGPNNFGPYAEAVARWEHTLGRPAPAPHIEQRLNPAFVEHMMGYPKGWVTDVLTRRTQSLKALGNAVVPQCAAEAFLQLCTR